MDNNKAEWKYSDDMVYQHRQNMFWREFKNSEAYEVLENDLTQEKDRYVYKWIKEAYPDTEHDDIVKLKAYIFTRYYSE